MVTIFKNFTTIAITFGDYLLYGNPISPGVAISLLIMFFGSFFASLNDLEFNFWGYVFMLGNCTAQTCYVLYMRKALTKLDNYSAVFYNNVLSIPLLVPFVVFHNEFTGITEAEAVISPSFYLVVIASAITGFCISLTTFWAISATSPTTYSVVGSLNKIPLTIIGSYVFQTKFSTAGLLSIIVALFGGVVYSAAKHQQAMAKQTEKKSEVV